ncbi:Plp1p [Sporobolomyces salmoneus]|uniref:Plp1p n=1 Tax=Sporobolomyces salmoneus TaxID=183962 RepID=UPI00317B3CDF
MSHKPSASSVHSKPHHSDSDHDDDSDALLEELEEELDNDFELGGFREKRMMELKAQIDAAQRRQESGYGQYSEIKVEKVLCHDRKAPRSVVHFFHPDFRRCKIMDKHLERLAEKHTDTLFLKADVANVPFLVNKLGVKVLPCVIGFAEGNSKMKLVGFDELDGGDDFNTKTLEIGMVQCGVLNKFPGSTNSQFPRLHLKQDEEGSSSTSSSRTKLRSGTKNHSNDDSDFDD